MADKKRQPLMTPLRQDEADEAVDYVMQDLDPKVQEKVMERTARKAEQEKSMANTGMSPKEVLRQQVSAQAAPDRQPKSDDAAKKELMDRQRQQMDDGMRDALSYFGPRLAALLIGGTEAMEITGEVLGGYEAFSGRQQEMRQEQELRRKAGGRAPMTEFQAEQVAVEKGRLKAMGQEREAQARAQVQKMQDLKTQQLNDINTKLAEFGKAQEGLAKGGVTGLFDKYGAAVARRMGLGDPSTTTTQQILREMRVDEALESVAKTKGAISDAEMKLFLEKAPSMTADESEWKVWLDRRREALENARKRIETGEMAERPASQEDIMKLTSTEVELPDGSIRRIPNSQLKTILAGRGQ